MNISSTISALNKFTADVKKLRKELESTTAAEPQQITPDQLKEALNILTYCWVNMDGQQFEAALDPEKKSINYWLGKFRIMQRGGWAALWCNVDPDGQNKYSNAIIKYYNQQKESK